MVGVCSVILLIILITQQQRRHEQNAKMIITLQERLEKIEQKTPNEFASLSNELKQLSTEHYSQMLERQQLVNVELSKQVMQSVHETAASISKQLKQDLHTYVFYDEMQQTEWLQLIRSQQDQRVQIQLLESALNKFPSNRTFFEEYINLLKASQIEATPRAKKTILEKMNHVSRIFFDNCQAQDANFAQKMKDDAVRLGHDFMKEQDQAQEKQLAKLVKQLELLVADSGNVNLAQIEQIDGEINKVLLKNYPVLLRKYQQITAQLTTKLMEKPSEERIKLYNLQAVKSFKIAQEYFKINEVNVKNGVALTGIVEHLGGWDMAYLSPPAQIYYQSVYADIFGKLEAEVKPTMTEQMLQANAKGM